VACNGDHVTPLRFCNLVYDAAGPFSKCLQSDRGPVTLNQCEIERHVIASALAGGSRATGLKPYSRLTIATLTNLDLLSATPLRRPGAAFMLSDEQKTHRTRLLAEMGQHDTVLHTIVLLKREIDMQSTLQRFSLILK
jgi:hypothetical protein